MSEVSRIKIQPGDALLIVDVQNDFLPGGRLAVPEGDAVIAPLAAAIERFRAARRPVFASRDWHPADHCSFREQGGPWPPHCIAGTPGAQISAALPLPPDAAIIDKATTRDADAYSAFQGTDLAARLRRAEVRRLFIGGLATDYCVLNTVLDALAEGFAVVVLEDTIRAVEARPGDGERAIARMQAKGALFAASRQLA